MDAFVKSFATYRTIKKARVISSALVLDSLDPETTTVTVVGTEIGRSNTDDWLVIDGQIYQISVVKPQTDRTMLTLVSPENAFARSLELAQQAPAAVIGEFIAEAIRRNWVACDDPTYAMPYLVVSNSDTTGYVPPELDNSGCFDFVEYCNLMRKSHRVAIRFKDAGNQLVCSISKLPVATRQVSFEDGRSQLQSVDYSSSGTAKLTVLRDVPTGEKDADGNDIVTRERTTWYLAEDGTVSQLIPARRASGKWKTIHVSGDVNVEEKVLETFAKNKANHKLEFWSTLDLSVQDDCKFLVYGEPLQSYISYKRKSSADDRYYYKSGELATTATEKLRGVMK
jgi:hypothetical protein